MSQKLDKWKKHHTGIHLCWDSRKKKRGGLARMRTKVSSVGRKKYSCNEPATLLSNENTVK